MKREMRVDQLTKIKGTLPTCMHPYAHMTSVTQRRRNYYTLGITMRCNTLSRIPFGRNLLSFTDVPLNLSGAKLAKLCV